MLLKTLDISGLRNIPPEYTHAHVMVRSDAHTVWRGNQMTKTVADELVAVLSGRQQQTI
jgi:hypothetical protein